MVSWLLLPALWVTGIPGASEPTHVLDPGQDRAARVMVGLDRPELTDQVRIQRVVIDRDRLRIELVSEDGSRWAEVLAPRQGGEGLIKTPVGALRLPGGLRQDARDALVARLRTTRARLTWRALVLSIDAQAARQEAQELSARVEARLGRSTDERPGDRQLGAVQDALDTLLTGAVPKAHQQAASLLTREDSPPGAVSIWLASGRTDEAPCAQGDACPIRAVVHALQEGRFDIQWAARWSEEPRLLLLAARNALSRGEPRVASALLRQALAAPLADQAVIDQAVAWGWGPGSSPEGALPADRSGEGSEPGGGGLWGALAALLLWLVAWRVAIGRTRRRLWAFACLLALGSVGVAQVMMQPTQDPQVAESRWEDPWLTLGRGTRCAVSAPAVTSEAWAARVRCGTDRGGVVLRRAPQDRAHTTTEHHALLLLPEPPGAPVGPELERWVRSMGDQLEQRERDGVLLASGPATVRPDGGAGRTVGMRLAQQPVPDQRLIALTAAVATLALVAWLVLLGRAWCDLAGWAEGARRRRLLGILLVVAVSIHVLAPSRMVMVYSGYNLVDGLLEWTPLRYGAGANLLYGPWLALVGPDHGVVQLVNRFYGLASWLLLAGTVVRLRPGATAFVAALALLTPMLWKDHASESILVGGNAMLLAAMYGVSVAVERADVRWVLIALPCALLAAMTRPEIALLTGPLLVVVWLHGRPGWSKRAWTVIALAGCAATLVAIPHVTWVQETVRLLRETGAFPGMDGMWTRTGADLIDLGGLMALSTYGPASYFLWVPVALLFHGQRVLVAGLIVVLMAWLAITRVDLPPVSIPRVHAPPLTILVLLSGLGMAAVWQRAAAMPSLGRRVALGILMAASWLVPSAMTWSPVYAPTNADIEDQLIADAVEALPPGRVCLATIDPRDPPAPGKTHRFFPYYLFEDRPHPPTLTHLGGLSEALGACPDGAYALLGMRCYMHLREGEDAGPQPAGARALAGCASFRAAWRLEPVVAFDAPNHGDVTFPMYPDGDTLPVGLYRVMGPRATGGGQEAPGTPARHGQPR